MLSGTHTANTIAPKVATQAETQAQPKTDVKVVQGYTTGTYEVGTGVGQVPPGKYQCSDGYFARLKGTTGSFDDIIANGIADGPTVLTILPSDKAIQFDGTWLWMG